MLERGFISPDSLVGMEFESPALRSLCWYSIRDGLSRRNADGETTDQCTASTKGRIRCAAREADADPAPRGKDDKGRSGELQADSSPYSATKSA